MQQSMPISPKIYQTHFPKKTIDRASQRNKKNYIDPKWSQEKTAEQGKFWHFFPTKYTKQQTESNHKFFGISGSIICLSEESYSK